MSVWHVSQDRVVALLRGAIERERMPHAYLFTGPPGAPLVETALALAQVVECQSPPAPGEACGHCGACEKVIAGIHPDVVTLLREGPSQTIPIETVRHQVVARMGLPPHEGNLRVFLVEEATSMAPATANALLKTLEEPPARTLFVLCSTAPEQLLPTIRSRCQRVRFAGGTGIASDADAARADRVAALGAELAAPTHEPTLAVRVAENKGDCGPVLVAAARALHASALAAASRGETSEAARASTRAQAILGWHTAVVVTNANPQLAIEALVAQLHGLP
ncbi:MAG TPA: hypothetical protein VGM88_16935 [Kofleriaceae bacterium]